MFSKNWLHKLGERIFAYLLVGRRVSWNLVTLLVTPPNQNAC